MEMLDRYINEVVKNLPRRQRSDIGSEIRSTLEDMLEERSQEAGKPVDAAMLAEVLRSYGSPASVASTYKAERYLVGPQLYPLFSFVVKIVLAVLGVLALVGLGIGLAGGEPEVARILKAIGSSIANFYSVALGALGNIVLVFAILERVLPDKEKRAADPFDEKWEPQDLMKAPAPDAVSLWEPVLAILFSFIALVIFNFYPQILSYTPSLNDFGSRPLVFFPILSDAFFRLLPWLNLQWVLQIGLNMLLLRRRRWSAGARLVYVGIEVLGIGILIAMLRGPSLLNLSPEALAAWPTVMDGIKQLTGFLNTIIRVVLYVAVFGSVIEVIKSLSRLVTRPLPVK